jgi:sugar phosphate isomerase/epimerase
MDNETMQTQAAAMEIGLLIGSLDQLEDVATCGYDYAEISPSLLGIDEESGTIEQKALEQVQASPAPVTAMCGFLARLKVVGPEADNARVRDYVVRLFDGMQQAGVPVIGYGSGGSRFVPDGFSRDRALEQVNDFLQMCADLGEPRGVQVALEPYNYDDANLINTVPEGVEMVQKVNRPGIQLMADFFHMRLNGESFDTLAAAGPYLIHAHIAEPGRERPQTTPAEHAAYLQALCEAGYYGRVTQTGELPAYDSPTEAAETLKRFARAGGEEK